MFLPFSALRCFGICRWQDLDDESNQVAYTFPRVDCVFV